MNYTKLVINSPLYKATLKAALNDDNIDNQYLLTKLDFLTYQQKQLLNNYTICNRDGNRKQRRVFRSVLKTIIKKGCKEILQGKVPSPTDNQDNITLTASK